MSLPPPPLPSEKKSSTPFVSLNVAALKLQLRFVFFSCKQILFSIQFDIRQKLHSPPLSFVLHLSLFLSLWFLFSLPPPLPIFPLPSSVFLSLDFASISVSPQSILLVYQSLTHPYLFPLHLCLLQSLCSPLSPFVFLSPNFFPVHQSSHLTISKAVWDYMREREREGTASLP